MMRKGRKDYALRQPPEGVVARDDPVACVLLSFCPSFFFSFLLLSSAFSLCACAGASPGQTATAQSHPRCLARWTSSGRPCRALNSPRGFAACTPPEDHARGRCRRGQRTKMTKMEEVPTNAACRLCGSNDCKLEFPDSERQKETWREGAHE